MWIRLRLCGFLFFSRIWVNVFNVSLPSHQNNLKYKTMNSDQESCILVVLVSCRQCLNSYNSNLQKSEHGATCVNCVLRQKIVSLKTTQICRFSSISNTLKISDFWFRIDFNIRSVIIYIETTLRQRLQLTVNKFDSLMWRYVTIYVISCTC